MEKPRNKTLSWSEGMSSEGPGVDKVVTMVTEQNKKALFTNETTAIIWGMQARAVQVCCKNIICCLCNFYVTNVQSFLAEAQAKSLNELSHFRAGDLLIEWLQQNFTVRN